MTIGTKAANFLKDARSSGFPSACMKRLFYRFPSGRGHEILRSIESARLARDLKKAEASGACPWNRGEFESLLRKYPKFLNYYKNRWEYLEMASVMAMKERPGSILELGAHLLPLFKRSDVMDVKRKIPRQTYQHDLTRVPWPVKDKAYDLVMALQVWEHLEGGQEAAFREVMRVSRSAVMSFPYLWNKPGDIHHGIDKTIIGRWTLHHPPEEIIEVGKLHSRIIYRFRF